MGFRALLLFLLPVYALAHEIQSTTQHLSISRQNETGWQQDLTAKIDVSRTFDVGLQGTYLERFDFYEKRAGGFLVARPNEKLSLEARYLVGNGNEILPLKQGILSAYYSLAQGLTPYLFYRDTKYSVTHLNTGTFGMEIEKIRHVILIPQVVYGKATFESPAETKDVYNFGLRAIYYQENSFSLMIFGYLGKEASQGIIGASNILVDTKTLGLGAGYFIIPHLKLDLIVDHTDYDQLKTQFTTTTLNFVWKL